MLVIIIVNLHLRASQAYLSSLKAKSLGWVTVCISLGVFCLSVRTLVTTPSKSYIFFSIGGSQIYLPTALSVIEKRDFIKQPKQRDVQLCCHARLGGGWGRELNRPCITLKESQLVNRMLSVYKLWPPFAGGSQFIFLLLLH